MKKKVILVEVKEMALGAIPTLWSRKFIHFSSSFVNHTKEAKSHHERKNRPAIGGGATRFSPPPSNGRGRLFVDTLPTSYEYCWCLYQVFTFVQSSCLKISPVGL